MKKTTVDRLAPIGCLLFLLTPILILFLAIYIESESPEKIYPEKGLFMKEDSYIIDCGLRNQENFRLFEIKLIVNKSEGTVRLLHEDRSIPSIDYVEFYSDDVTFETNGVSYFLDRFTGEIDAGKGYPEASGSCIEEGWRWSFDETRNVRVYERDMKYKQN